MYYSVNACDLSVDGVYAYTEAVSAFGRDDNFAHG